jgi:hypothetical protein
VNRRDFISLLGGKALWPRVACSQQLATKMLRVGTASALQATSPTWAAFMQRMAELGYEEGKTFTFDFVPVATKRSSKPATGRLRRANHHGHRPGNRAEVGARRHPDGARLK